MLMVRLGSCLMIHQGRSGVSLIVVDECVEGHLSRRSVSCGRLVPGP